MAVYSVGLERLRGKGPWAVQTRVSFLEGTLIRSISVPMSKKGSVALDAFG